MPCLFNQSISLSQLNVWDIPIGPVLFDTFFLKCQIFMLNLLFKKKNKKNLAYLCLMLLLLFDDLKHSSMTRREEEIRKGQRLLSQHCSLMETKSNEAQSRHFSRVSALLFPSVCARAQREKKWFHVVCTVYWVWGDISDAFQHSVPVH